MKKVIIYAYSKLNLGDDLFIKILCERYPHVKFFLLEESIYTKCFKTIKNIQCYSDNNFFFRAINLIFRKLGLNENFIKKIIINKADAVVYIGGSLFIQQSVDWQKNINNIEKKMIKTKPFYILGANFGPFKDIQYYEYFKNFFTNCDDICFRDKYSYNLFKDFSNIRLASDIIFQLKNNLDFKEKNYILISIIKPSIRKEFINCDNIYYHKIKETCISFIKKGFKIKLISFCKYEKDEEAIKEILSIIPNEYSNEISTYFYLGNINEAIKVVQEAKAVVATRFHSLILALLNNKPVFSIIYSEKIKNVIDDVNFKGNYIYLKDINKLNADKIIESFNGELTNISNQIAESENHFKKLDIFLND